LPGSRVKGNLTTDGTIRYEWDAENRLIATQSVITPIPEQSLRVEFSYDYMGRRVRMELLGRWSGEWVHLAEEQYVYDGWTLDTPLRASPGHRGAMGPAGPDAASQGWNVILVLDGLADVNEDGQPDILRKYTWGFDLSGQAGNTDTPAGIHGAGGTLDTSGRRQGQVGGLLSVEETTGEHQGTYWFMHDANGNVSQIVKDGTWALAAHYEYDPYGNVIRSTGSYAAVNPFRFSTKWLDGESGLYYYGYRYYSPRLGRWVSRDPIGEEGGLNLYAFLANGPFDSIDPDGRQGVSTGGKSTPACRYACGQCYNRCRYVEALPAWQCQARLNNCHEVCERLGRPSSACGGGPTTIPTPVMASAWFAWVPCPRTANTIAAYSAAVGVGIGAGVTGGMLYCAMAPTTMGIGWTGPTAVSCFGSFAYNAGNGWMMGTPSGAIPGYIVDVPSRLITYQWQVPAWNLSRCGLAGDKPSCNCFWTMVRECLKAQWRPW
jgi:RHS repeat-associated protein